jgi:hypothetical protein
MFVTTTLPKNLHSGFQKSGCDRALVVAKSGCVYLIGENNRSSLYAVYDFLQEFASIEFFGPGLTPLWPSSSPKCSTGVFLLWTSASAFTVSFRTQPCAKHKPRGG